MFDVIQQLIAYSKAEKEAIGKASVMANIPLPGCECPLCVDARKARETKMKEVIANQELLIETRRNREKFRQELSFLGHSEATTYNHWALEAYDRVHCPELRLKAIDVIDEAKVVIKRNGVEVYRDS